MAKSKKPKPVSKPGKPVMKYGKLQLTPFPKDYLGKPKKRPEKKKRMPPAIVKPQD